MCLRNGTTVEWLKLINLDNLLFLNWLTDPVISQNCFDKGHIWPEKTKRKDLRIQERFINRIFIRNILSCNLWDSNIVDIFGALFILSKEGARDVNNFWFPVVTYPKWREMISLSVDSKPLSSNVIFILETNWPKWEFKDTYAVWEFHSKNDFFNETYFWPFLSSIIQIWDKHIVAYHSKVSKTTFMVMTHHCDVINTSLKRVNQKTYLTHHS